MEKEKNPMKNIQTLIKAATALKAGGDVTHPNREGASSYYRSLEEQVVSVLTTGTLGDTFYAKAEKIGIEALEVLLRARAEVPEFLARALVYAREKGLMRTLPVLGLVVLSGGRGKTKPLFEAVFDRVIRTPDDLRVFVTLCVSGAIPGRAGLGGVARDATRRWLAHLSEYHAVKYGSAASREVTLRDVVRMAHPRPDTPALAERFGWLVAGSGKLGDNPALNPQIRALEALKAADTEDGAVALIRQGRLPYEVVVPTLKSTSTAIWSELLRQAPYFNLLRNLVTFTRHGVFASEEKVGYAVQRLTDPRAVHASKVLPFRFFDAWRAYQASDVPDSRIADAIRAALELSFASVPSLGDRTVALAPDISDSMRYDSHKVGHSKAIEIAGIMAGALLRRIEGRVIPLPFNDRPHPSCGLSARDDILVTTEKIQRMCGGGTSLGAPVQYLLDRKIPVEVFIGITDDEEWAYGGDDYSSGSFLSLWRRYKAEVSPDARAFLLTLVPYRDASVPQSEADVHFIYGWSDDVLKYIALALESGMTQIRAIEQMDLSKGGPNGTLAQSNEPENVQEE